MFIYSWNVLTSLFLNQFGKYLNCNINRSQFGYYDVLIILQYPNFTIFFFGTWWLIWFSLDEASWKF